MKTGLQQNSKTSLIQELSQKDLVLRAEAKQALMNMERDKPYLFYTPNGKCEQFISLIGQNKKFINLLIAANGVGKTAVMVNIIANIVFSPKNKWFNYPLFNEFPYIKQGRIISDTTTVAQTIIPELYKWFPKGKFQTSHEGKQYESKWVHEDHAFDIMTYEQDLAQFESKTLGWAYFDEPPPEEIFKATISRMRLGGIIIAGFTPLSGSAFFYDEYVTSQDTEIY